MALGMGQFGTPSVAVFVAVLFGQKGDDATKAVSSFPFGKLYSYRG
jgi:hypothetical protein